MSGRRIQLLVDRKNDTLDDVRKKIEAKEGINQDQQRLLMNGINLVDDTIENLNIEDGMLLFLTLRNRGG